LLSSQTGVFSTGFKDLELQKECEDRFLKRVGKFDHPDFILERRAGDRGKKGDFNLPLENFLRYRGGLLRNRPVRYDLEIGGKT